MGVGRFSRPRRKVVVLGMLDAEFHTTRHVESVCEVPLGAGVLQLFVPDGAVAVILDLSCVADGVEITR